MSDGRHVPGWGRLDAKLVLIGEAPGPREEAVGEPFVGPSYHLKLNVWWNAVGLKRHDFRIENVCEYRPPGNKADAFDKDTWDAWMANLHERLALLDDPWLIVPTGNYSLYALTGKGNVHWNKRDGKNTRPGITDWRGSILSYTDRRGRTIKVIPTIHPAATFRTASYEALCRRDWARIAEERHDRALHLPTREHVISPSIGDCQDYLRQCEADPELRLVVDIENPQEELGPPLVAPIVCVGFSATPQLSFTIPTTKGYWKNPEALEQAWGVVEQLCQLACSAHNGFHERYWLGQERGLELPNLVWDTMLMHHALDPTSEHRLDYCASVDTRQPFWKHEAKDPEDMRKYTSNMAAFYCVDTETECLTKDGWRRYDQVKTGDEILAYDTEFDTVAWSPMCGVFKKPYNGLMCSFWWRNREIALTTPNHRWWVRKRQRKGQEVVSSDFPLSKKGHTTGWSIPGSARWGLQTGFFDPLKTDLVQLVAWVVSEGTIRQRGSSVEVVVYQSLHSRYFGELSNLMQTNGATARVMPKDEIAFYLPTSVAKPLLRWIQPKPHKHLTHEFIHRLDRDGCRLFLETLEKGDGRGQHRGIVQTATSPLVDQVQMLAVLSGWGTSKGIRQGSTYPGSKPCAHVSFFPGKQLNVQRRASRHYEGVVWCPRVKTGYWVARRNGTVYITGNTYNGIDCCVQRELLDIYYDRLAAQTRETSDGEKLNGLDWYWLHYAELMGPLLELGATGIKVDDARRVQRKHELEQELDEIKAKLMVYGVDLFAKKKLSGKKVKDWLYGTLKFPQQLRKRSTHEKTVSSDALAIRKLMSHHQSAPLVNPEVRAARRCFDAVAPLLLRIERVAKLKEFYADKRVSADGRFRSSYGLNTKEGRLNSKAYYDKTGSNGQNVDRESRDMFVADDGCIGLQVDGSQAEGRVCLAWMYHLTRRHDLIEQANSLPDRYDMHTATARGIFKRQEITKHERYFAKTVVHGAQRMMTGQTMSDNAAKRGIVLDPAECDAAINAYKQLVPLEEFFNWVKRDVQRNKVLYDTWGGRYDFSYERMDDATFREACSTRMQPEVARWMNQWGVKPLMELLKRYPGSRLNVHVHDGLFLSVKPEVAYDVAAFLVNNLERPRLYGTARMTIPCEVAIGHRWKAAVEFKRLPSREEFTARVEELVNTKL